MPLEPEHKPSPWGRVAAENARSSRFVPPDRLTGFDAAIDADLLRRSVELDPAELASLMGPVRPTVVSRLLAARTPNAG